MVVALFLVCFIPRVVTRTSSIMHPRTFALLPRPLSAPLLFLRCSWYVRSKWLGTYLF